MEPLDHLKEYCREELDARTIENEIKLKGIIKAFPALWPTLDAICNLEHSKFLPRHVSKIVEKILAIRFQTFQDATKRSNSDYFLWSNPLAEHPTQCYPMLPLWRHPSKYKVSDQIDSDLCEKTFSYHSDFCAGFYRDVYCSLVP